MLKKIFVFSFFLSSVFCLLFSAVSAQDIRQLEEGETGGMAKYKEWIEKEKPQISRTEVIPGKLEEVKVVKEEAMPTISMDFQDANMKDILKIFSQQSGLNFIAGEKIKDSRITLYLDKVSVEDALNTILKGNNLTYEQAEDSDIFIVKQTSEPEIETTTRVYTLNYAQVEEEEDEDSEGGGMQEVVENILSEHGKIICYGRTNSLIITDIPTNFERIEKTIKEIDTPTPMVMIEAEILETIAGLTEKLGIDWSATLTWTAPTDDLWPNIYHSNVGHFPRAKLIANSEAVLNLLLTDTHTKYLAKPKICVLNNEKAIIDITADMVVGIKYTVDDDGVKIGEEAERMEIGTKLTVTPHINPQGEITLTLEPEVSRAADTKFGETVSTVYKDKLQRKVNTKVLVKDGHTVIIAGLLSHDDKSTKKKIRFFGDIPLLGNLFKYESKEKDQTEIVIFITPHIVRYWEEAPTTTALPFEQEYEEYIEDEILQLEPIVVN